MTKRIILEPCEVWDYCVQHAATLEDSPKLIADNITSGAQIYISFFGMIPTIFACIDSEEVDEEPIADEEDCVDTVEAFYERYLDDFADEMLGLDISREYEEEKIDKREDELINATAEMLETFVPNFYEIAYDADEVCNELADLVCEFLYRNYDISVYRPMYLECDDGSKEFSEHPYEEMDYDED